MATPFAITTNFKNGGIRQGKAYLIQGDEGAYTAASLGRIKNPMINLEPVESDQDSQGRTTVIAYNLNASVSMMQHTHDEIEAAGQLAYPADGSPEEAGYNLLFTDGPLSQADVEAALNTVEGRIVPGILMENVYPKPTINVDFGTNDSAIDIAINGMLQPEALTNFATEPVLTFAS
jgi:hypothetical protein